MEKSQKITIRDFQKKMDFEDHCTKMTTDHLEQVFKEMVEKYHLKTLVSAIEAAGQDVFSAIIPFIVEREDRERYKTAFLAK